jgi:hypothetical protein
VHPDLRAISGELQIEGGAGLRLVDALQRLPVPADDELLRLTFPAGANEGWLHLRPAPCPSTDLCVRFYTVLPDRWGASGRAPGRGLFLNGLWHPQPLGADGAPVLRWEVEVSAPPGAVLVVNDAVGETGVRWAGAAERVALAVVPGGAVLDVGPGVGRVQLVQRGALPRRRRQERLREVIREGWPGPQSPQLVIVETPDWRRLTRSGPGVLFLSDRAFRLSGPLWQFHTPAVRAGVLQAGLPIDDPFARSIAAAALAEQPAPDPREILGWFSWIPEIDQLLYDGRLPFYSDVFAETWPGDRVADDLLEVVDPRSPGAAVVRKLRDAHGPDAARALADGLAAGLPLDEAAAAAGLSPSAVEAWRARPPAQRLHLEVHPGGRSATLHREGPASLPAEPIPVELRREDGPPERLVWAAPPGPGAWTFPLPDGVRGVQVDPGHDVLQAQDDRTDDRWPLRWTTVAAFFPTEWAVTNRRISLSASALLRRQYSTRWAFLGDVSTDPINLVDVTIGALRFLGPLQDRRNRPLRIWFGAGPAVLDPDFRSTEAGGLALGAYAGVAHETRVDALFPRHGHRLSLGGSGGVVPASGQAWALGSASAVQAFDLGGRVALLARGGGGLAAGEVEHRLLALGGGTGFQGLPPQAVVGRQRLLAGAELRAEVLRQASVPGPLVWLSSVQLTGGLELGQLSACAPVEACPARALGWTAGLNLVGDVLGARPTLLGATVARPLLLSETLGPVQGPPQSYIRLTQSF